MLGCGVTNPAPRRRAAFAGCQARRMAHAG